MGKIKEPDEWGCYRALQEFSSQWDIKATPTFFFLKDGRQFDKLVGAKKEELQKKITSIADSLTKPGGWHCGCNHSMCKNRKNIGTNACQRYLNSVLSLLCFENTSEEVSSWALVQILKKIKKRVVFSYNSFKKFWLRKFDGPFCFFHTNIYSIWIGWILQIIYISLVYAWTVLKMWCWIDLKA